MKFIILAIFCCILSSCSFTTHQNRVSNVQKRSIIAQPVVVDIKVDFTKKVSGEGVGKVLDIAKQGALAATMESSGADLIVEPLYTVQHLRGSLKVKVVGFYAKYENPRTFLEVIKETNNNGALEKLLDYLNPERITPKIIQVPVEEKKSGF